jgi:EAL and modified HD-GYP domain-containing signal transduction protein
VIKGQRSPTNRLVILELLAKIQSPGTTFGELEALISRDVSVSYKVLRAANAAIYTRARKIESIHQARQLVGLTAITNIVSLFLLANIDDKPHELLITAMVRAKMCEQLAKLMQQSKSATFFTVGLLSVLDAFMDCPMPDILPRLSLADDIVAALLAHEGMLGATLRCVLAYEQGDWEAVQNLGCPRDLLVKTYLEALMWATEMHNAF